jgi:hypothetical protein
MIVVVAGFVVVVVVERRRCGDRMMLRCSADPLL